MGQKGNLAVFESSGISETGEATPTKVGVHAFDINPYLHKFFDPILFFDPMDYNLDHTFPFSLNTQLLCVT